MVDSGRRLRWEGAPAEIRSDNLKELKTQAMSDGSQLCEKRTSPLVSELPQPLAIN